MKKYIDKDFKKLFFSVIFSNIIFILILFIFYFLNIENKILYLIIIYILSSIFVLISLDKYFNKNNNIIKNAKKEIQEYILNNSDINIDCDFEGEIYKLFHEINLLFSILNAHHEKELQSKKFFKKIIFDISHQIKTPMAALNIYNGIIIDESKDFPNVAEFANLSEKELDRINILIKNLLTIAKFDTDTITMNKSKENLSMIFEDIKNHFIFRANIENKKIDFFINSDLTLYCDPMWIKEAISNLIKNALDHTKSGDTISISSNSFGSILQIIIKDNGFGIHEEDINHIFKRFYRSKFSKDTQGVGLGLPLTKSIIQSHEGNIQVHSTLNKGTTFIINFLNPTNL